MKRETTTTTTKLKEVCEELNKIITFGSARVTEDDNEVELIQHVSQISFLLMVMKRRDPDQPRQEMGFHVLYREWYGSEDEEQDEKQ